MRDPSLVAARDRVTVAARTGSGDWDGTGVALSLRDGRLLEDSVDLNIPTADVEHQWDRLAAKFASLAGPLLDPSSAAALPGTVRESDRAPSLRALIEMTRVGTPVAV
jgi:hypothetical protein